jgi:hypothetical protein
VQPVIVTVWIWFLASSAMGHLREKR